MDGRIKALVALAAVLLALSTYWYAKPTSFVVCNTAPYATKHLAYAKSETGYKLLSPNWITLSAGSCSEFRNYFWQQDRELLVHSAISDYSRSEYKYVDDINVQQMLEDENVENDDLAINIPYSDVPLFGDQFSCWETEALPPKTIRQFTQANVIPECTESSYVAYFVSAAPIVKQFEIHQSKWHFIFESPHFSLIPNSGDFELDLQSGMSAAQDLSRAIGRQFSFFRLQNDTSPFSVGGKLNDFNGPLNWGVGVQQIAVSSIFGRPMSLQNEDIILQINGVNVYGTRDLFSNLYRHGVSRTKGIQVPVIYTIKRNGYDFQIADTYFFNSSYYRQNFDSESVAFWYGVGDGVLFGQTPWVTCNGGNVLQGAKKAFAATAGWIASKTEKFDYNGFRPEDVEFIDAEECKWQKDQSRAAARQRQSEVYENSQWVAIVTPSAVRLAFQKGARKKMAQQVGKGATSRALSTGVADAGLEALETALWSFGTSAPGTPLAERFKEAGRVAPMGAGAGFITGASMKFLQKKKPNKSK